MATNPTVADLFKAREVTLDDLTAATDDVLAGIVTSAYPLTKNWTLDLIKMLRMDARAREALKTDETVWKRNMVRTAILLAHPVKG
jgi:hypothetical protein